MIDKIEVSDTVVRKSNELSFSISVALTCRLIQLLILFYGIGYLMIYKKGYQEMDTSIISSITLKVKVEEASVAFVLVLQFTCCQ
jgi:hypothetical protein